MSVISVAATSCARRIWALVVLGVVCGMSAASSAQPLPEATVKAAFIGKFAEFVAWPVDVLPAQAPIEICLSASQPFGDAVTASAAGKTVKGHPITVRDLKKNGARPDRCHVLYVASGDRELLQRAQALSVLTVGDQPDFCQLGGIVNFRVIGGHVRFEVNLTQAKRAGLRLDSQFLRLASAVIGGQP